MRGMGVALMTSTSGRAPLPAIAGALRHAEAVLFVRDDQPRAGQSARSSCSSAVRAHDHARLAAADAQQRPAPAGACPIAPWSRQGRIAELLAKRRIVLPREDLRRRHERALIAVCAGDAQRVQRHGGLAGADVALEQAVHRRGRGHIAGDLAHHAPLRRRRRKRQRREIRLQHAAAFERDARKTPPLLLVQLDGEQIAQQPLKGERAPRAKQRLARGGTMRERDRLRQRQQIMCRAQPVREGVVQFGRGRQRLPDGRAEEALRQPLGKRGRPAAAPAAPPTATG